MSSDRSIRIDSNRGRIDLEIKVVGTAPDGTLEIEMEPNSDRYEWRDGQAGRELYDRSTGSTMPEDVVWSTLKQMKGAPIYGPPPAPDHETFVLERAAAIEAALKGENGAPLADPSHDALVEMLGKPVGFAVISVDLVGSTKLQAEHPEVYDRIVPVLGQEVAAVGAAFGGLTINFTGDGGLLGFPGPEFCVAADAAFDAATAIVADVYLILNPLLSRAGLPSIDVRVGLDGHDGKVQLVGDPSNRRRAEVLGLAVSIASKVQARAQPRDVLVGQSLYEVLHVSRQQLLGPAEDLDDWDFVDRDDEPYRLYRFAVVRPG
jgi:class 3 adenylate cyclase